MSAPAPKALLPAPRRITQRRSDSSESSRMRLPSSRHDDSDRAFRLSGRLRMTVAIGPSRCTRTGSDMVGGISDRKSRRAPCRSPDQRLWQLLAERNRLLDKLRRAGHFLTVFLVDRLARRDKCVLVDLIDL